MNSNSYKYSSQFTYDIYFHVQLVSFLLVLFIARTGLRRWWQIQVPVSWRWRLLKWSLLGNGNASVLSRGWLLGPMSGCLSLSFVTWCRCLFPLLQMTATVGWLVACLRIDPKNIALLEKLILFVEWKLNESRIIRIRSAVWISFAENFKKQKNHKKSKVSKQSFVNFFLLCGEFCTILLLFSILLVSSMLTKFVRKHLDTLWFP